MERFTSVINQVFSIEISYTLMLKIEKVMLESLQKGKSYRTQ